MLSHVLKVGFFIVVAKLAGITVMSKAFFGGFSSRLFLYLLIYFLFLWLMCFQVIFKRQSSPKSSFTSLKGTYSNDFIIFLYVM